ncbi:MAG: DUF5057 domain-containing protein [Lachnospiraceae bacterium]|nr:DUF5057 domain-containing protein [Lachnospiraceae bacterium]
MKKKNQIWMKGISVALAVVVAATTVLHIDERLLARETFSGLKSILANNQQLTIVEVVDDFSESSMGYLFGGLEPYDVERAKREGTMDVLLEELSGRGLLTMGDTDDWSSYPLRYEVLETRYSEFDGDEEILGVDGFRQQESTATELSGYYVPIDASEEKGGRAFYRCLKGDYEAMQYLTPADLREAAKGIQESYALALDENGDIKYPEGYPDGYTIDDKYQYFRFVVGDPKDAIEAQNISDMPVYTGDSSVGAMYGIRVTEEASLEDAAPTPTDGEDEDEMQSDGDDDITTVPEEPEAGDVVPTPEQPNNESEGDAADTDDEATDNDAAQEEDRAAQSDNTVQSNDVVPEADTPRPDNAASTEQTATLSNENENAGTDSASAVIYVQFDENNSVLVASLGNAGVGDVLDGTPDTESEQSGAEKSASGGSDTGIVNGAIPTVTPSATPAPTPTQGNGGDTAGSDNNSSTSDTTGNSEDENTDDESGSNKENTGDDGSDQGSADGSENTDGDDQNAEDGDGEDGDAEDEDGEDGDIEDEDGEDGEDGEDIDDEEDENGEDEKEYTVTYRWEGLDHEIGTFTEPDLPGEETVKDEEEITFPDDPEPIEVTDEEGVKIGTYVFEGWKVVSVEVSEDASEDADDTDTSVEENNKIITVVGTWSYHECESGFYLVTYQWRLTGEEGSLPNSLTADNIVLKSPFQTFDMSEQPEEIGLPDEGNVQEGSSYTLPDDYEDAVFDIYDTDGNYIGIGTFEGWENSDGETLEGEIVPDGDMTVYGVLSIALFSTEHQIKYNWSIRIGEEDNYTFLDGSQYLKEELLDPNTKLPKGVVLKIGGYLTAVPEFPEVTTWEDEGRPYMPANPVSPIFVYDMNNELVGTYTFMGWERADGGEWLPPDAAGFTIEGNIELRGVWSYEPEATSKLVPGNGFSYVYVNDTIHNNDWFRYYVMGLEEKDFGKVNIKLVTYLADGSQKREYGYGPDCPTLAEAIQKADLVYLNTDGQWLDDYGEQVFSERRFSAETAKALLARACNEDRSARLAVILDNSVRSNQVDVNMQKVTAILCQEDVAEAYASLSEDGMSYDKAFSSVEWQRLNALAVSRNGGNFVHDNIYCVSHARGEFNNSTYPANNADVVLSSMSALANADFENRFTDRVTDEGFAEVYQAIQKENYERARNGGQASLDEYVMPATAVAYILNFREYDPIIYKDKIRVLELEPCRDYTYYYDELDNPTAEGEMAKKRQFAEDWAPDFLDKLEADSDAITIDGMTTSEFCGKILDIYEEYDVIYIGSNNGILHTDDVVAGFKWVPMDAYDGTISADAPFQPYSWDSSQRFTYHDGKWYRLVDSGQTKRIRVGSPVKDVEVWDGSATWKWSVAENRWYRNGQLSDEPYSNWIGNFTQYDDQWVEHTYCYDQRIPSWCEFVKIYDEVEATSNDKPNGPDAPWYDNGSAETSGWLWNNQVWGMDCKVSENETQRIETRGWYKKEYVAAATYTTYYDSDMNGMLYTHVGDKMRYAFGNYYGHLVNEADYGYRSSGNDILATQVQELIDYLNGGSLVILSSDFMTTDENGRQILNSSDVKYKAGSQSYCGIMDTSSYVYQFVRSCFERETDGSDVPKYSNLIVEDYGNGDLRDTEAFVEALNQQKVTLNLYAMPTQYGYEECAVSGTTGTVTNKWNGQKETYTRNYSHDITRIDEDTRFMLQKEADGRYYLNYEFIIGNLSAIAPLTTRYHVQLFLDSNSDGIYNTATEELDDITVINAQTGAVLEREGGRYQLQMNVPYRVRRELPDGYVGCIGWKLMVTQNGNDHIHDSVTGLTAVAVQPGYSDEVNPLTGKKIIHVLQITPNLYGNPMDLELQTDLTNGWSGNGNFDEEWYELLTNLPDFEIDFDSIYYWDFAHSFLKPGESGYEAQYDNGGVDGKLTGPDGRNDYLNFYQYDMVIVGFCDMVPSIPSQAAVEALLNFANMGKSMLFTHDTTYSGWESQSDPSDFTFAAGLGQSFSMSIRDLCGMDRYGVSVDWYRYDETTGRAMNNKEGSPIRTPGAQASAYNASSAAYQWYASHPGGNSRDVAYAPGTNQTMMAAQTQGLTWSMTDNEYFYMYDWASHGKITRPHKNRDTWDAADTNTVTQVNGGIITQYPYDIPLRIEVGDTHAQYYQLDLETDRDGDGRGDVVCWYAMSSLNDGDWNDIYDFSPNDVRNNYYIYNKGNITYTGVGHSVDHITLDEKKLFINTFVAAYSAGIRNPSVRIVENGSVNAPDLENVSIPFNGVDEETAGTYRVYYQVKDNNITQGTRNLSVKYYIGNPAGSGTVTYRTEVISADLFADGELKTYSADTGLEVSYDAVRSGHSYYVDVPLTRLLNNETFDFYVEVDLTMADDPSRVAAFDVDKLTIAKLKMFSLD